MALLGRGIAISIGIVLLAAGAAGHLAGAPDGAAADASEALYDAVVEQVGRDRAERAFALLAIAPVRFGAPVLGLVVLFGALRPRREREREVADGDGDAHEPKASRQDRRLVKKTIKQAHALARKGMKAEAAELLFSCNELDRAAELFVQADDPVRAAEIRHDQNRFLDAAELYESAGDHGSAATIYAQQEEFQRAGECYLKDDSKSTAAEMFEKAGDFAQAGRLYRDVEFLRHAAQCFVRCSRWMDAAKCLDQVFREESLKGGAQDPAKHAEMIKLVRQAAKLFLKAEDPPAAIDILERGRCPGDAAKIALQLRDYAKAAELFRDAGDLEQAARALSESGDEAEAARALGEHCRDQGDLVEAAGHFERGGEFLAAGDLYRHVEDYARAGDCYTKQGEHEQAAEMFRLGGDREAASDAYERAGRFAEAAECCALSGQGEREAGLLEKAGRFVEAGSAYHREGLDDAAIAVLQRVEGEGFAEASSLLAGIFRGRGQLALAIKQLQQAIGDAELDRATLPMYYTLATLHEENRCPKEALELYERVMGVDYHHGDVEKRVAKLREQLGADPVPTAAAAAAAPPAMSAPGERYEIVGELGRGGMGIVYRARDAVLDRVVAFKVLPETFQENPQAVANFLREAKAAAKLNHPNIVTVYDAGEQSGRYYIAMEFVDGTTLKEILRRRGPIAPAGVLQVVANVCEALAYAHEKRVIHRDIKTANAMWTRDKKAKIMDFGLAKVVEEVRNHTTVVSGTPYYMSPEQTLGKNIDHRTDIYSLGVTAFELLTGSVPFKEGNIPYHHVHTAPPDVRDLREGVPEPVARLVARCLEKDAAARYQTAGDILVDVRSILAG